jgi:EmrB/QacA subfamily drug resistance transporter
MGERIDPYIWRVSFVVVIGSIMSILDTTIVNIALATLARELHATIDQIQWVVTGYMLALAAVIPVTGWAARRFGAKRAYLLSVALFTAGSALCGLASSAGELIGFRVLQGIGGGMILPVGQLMMAEAAGPKRMGRVMSIVAVPAMLAPILGPTLGGLILQNAAWRWIFYVNVPIGALAVIAAVRVLPRSPPKPAEALDYLGLVLMASGLPLLTYGLAEVGVTGGFSALKVLLPSLLGLALIAAFAVHALRAPRPLLELALYRRSTFSAAQVAMFGLGAALFGAMILLPLYWQEVRRESVIDTGLLTAPQGLGAALMMPVAGKLTDRLGGGPLALAGALLTAAMTVPFGFIGARTPIASLCLAMFGRGLGIGLAMVPAMTAALAALRRDQLSDATPQLNVLQRVGGSIGTAVLAAVLQRELRGAHTLAGAASAYGVAFWWACALAAVAVVPCAVLAVAERRARAERGEEARFGIDELAEAMR